MTKVIYRRKVLVGITVSEGYESMISGSGSMAEGTAAEPSYLDCKQEAEKAN